MGTLLVLFDAGRGEPVIDEKAHRQLARLGITTISLLGDAGTFGVVLEGWAFDPARSADEARTVIAGAERGARVLRPVRAAVTNLTQGGN